MTNNSATPMFSDEAVVIDLRTPGECAMSGVIEGAQVLDFLTGELTAALPTLSKDTQYLLYCRSGNRAGQAMIQMQQAGFTQVSNLGSLQQAAEILGRPIVK